jgi:hypothetical protein
MLGGSSYDPETKTWTETLSPEMQAIYDRFGVRADATATELAAMGTGEEAQKRFYNEQRSLFRPQEMRQRLGVENRLRSQGRLSTTGGAQAMGEFDYGQQMTDYNRQTDAYDKSQAQIDALRGRELMDMKGMLSIGALPKDYSKLGMAQGELSAKQAEYLAELKQGNIQDKYDTYSAGWGGLGSKIGGLGGNMFGNSGGGYQGSYEPWGNQGGFEFDQGGPEWWTGGR